MCKLNLGAFLLKKKYCILIIFKKIDCYVEYASKIYFESYVSELG